MKLDLFILSILPVIVLIIWIYKNDSYEKEPIRLLLKMFLMGCVTCIPIIYIQSILVKIHFLNSLSNKLYLSFIVASFTEELLKYTALTYILKNKNFNEKLDGVIYSVLISLGFAMIENIVYVFMGQRLNSLNIGLNRAIISVPAHMLFGINMGYYISLYKFSDKLKGNKKIYLYKSLYSTILLHGIFNFILMLKFRWAMIIFIAYIIYLWKINLDKLYKYKIESKKRFVRIRRRKDDKH